MIYHSLSIHILIASASTTRTFITLVTFLFSSALLIAQLNGTYTIGGVNPDHLSIGDAVTALHTQGVSGPVTFEIRDGVYSEQVRIGPFAGASSSNLVTFRSESGDSSLVVIEHPGDGVILDSAMHVALERITVRSITGTFISRCLNIRGTTEFIRIEGCRFEGYYASNFMNGRLVQVEQFEKNSNVSIVGNSFQSGNEGLLYVGDTSLDPAQNILVENNLFEGQQRGAMTFSVVTDLIVRNNMVIGTSLDPNSFGIHLKFCDSTVTVENNSVTLNRGLGMHLQSCHGTMIHPFVVANNMLNSSCTPNQLSVALYLEDVQRVQFFYNSMNMFGSTTTSGPAIRVIDQPFTNNLLKNNSIVNSAGGYVLEMGGNTSFLETDHNNLYTTGPSLVRTNSTNYHTDLSAWQAFSGSDVNSVSLDPPYTSNIDLHLTNLSLNALGTPLSQVTFDIDGEPRDPFMPDIGADEIDLNVAIEPITTRAARKIFPNPTTGLLNIGPGPIREVICLDQLGQRLQIKFDMLTHELDLSSLPSGVYSLVIEASNERSTHKLIKH